MLALRSLGCARPLLPVMGFCLLAACAQADEPVAQVSDSDAAAGGSAGAAGAAGASGQGGNAGAAGQAGMGGSSGEAAHAGSAGASGSPTGGTGGYAGTGGTGVPDGGDEGGIVCGGEVCTNWLCEKTNIGVSTSVFGCCQSTNECGAVNEQDGDLCVPVEVVEVVFGVECKPD